MTPQVLASVLPLPPDASLDGFRVDGVVRLATWLALVCFALVVIALAYLLARYRARPGRTRGERVTGEGRNALAATLVLALAVFVGVDLNLEVHSSRDLRGHVWAFPAWHLEEANTQGFSLRNWRAWQGDPRERPGHHEPQLRVEVLAQQWGWNVRYPGADGRFGTPDDVVRWDELAVPRGVPVVLELGAKDVVHSFYVPSLRVKQDAVPGTVTRAWFVATRDGDYDIACAQVCGWAHFQMRGVLRVAGAEAFARWYEGEGELARAAWVENDLSAHWGWPWNGGEGAP